jgi:UDP-N-acetylmuramyl pentapeptide phosphotransferase/UDP-N-acetylglucosamine-1-phosphate transferase
MMFAAAILALAVSAWLTRRICDPASSLHVLDHPNERSLHTRPVPRTGGVAILVGMFAGFLIIAIGDQPGFRFAWLTVAVLLVAALSFVDDRRGLSVRVRLLGHVVAAELLVAGGLYVSAVVLPGIGWHWPAPAGIVLSILYLVWMVNLYNFMDGMDGFAGGMAVIGFGVLALLGGLAGNSAFLAVNLVIAAAVAGFLIFNFPPARIFMGDTGSAALGLLAGGLSLWGARDGVFPFWVAVLVFSPFVVDATATLVRRLWCGEQVWQAHRTHYYQRLVQLGWGHRKTVVAEYLLMLACGASAVLGVRTGPVGQWVILLGWCLAYPVLMLFVARIEQRVKRPA